MNKLVFVDESASNKKTGARKRGWSPKGVECSVLRSLKRSERWSILPALTIDRYLPDPLIIQGAVTKEVFVWWLLNRVLPLLQPGMIIVIDNASIHYNLEIDEALAIAGVAIKYLPPYLPDFNPIECTFYTLKAWIQRHFSELQWYPSFESFLQVALKESIGSSVQQYFVSCGYREV